MAIDTVLSKAVDTAREAAIEVADDATLVGDHLGATAISDRLVTHLFACTMPGYRGWVWSVTVARSPRAKLATVCEAHLIAADDALLAPAWVPWADRVQPGDIKPGMAVPRMDPDPRLVPGFTVTDEEDAEALAIWELGLGRERVLGPLGRDEAAERWYARLQDSPSESATASHAPCDLCAFVIPLTGSMRLLFGVCTNKWCPADGTVVTLDHCCGGHTIPEAERGGSQWPAPDPVFDSEVAVEFDLGVEQPAREAEPEPAPEAEPEATPEPDSIEVDGDTVVTSDVPGEPGEPLPEGDPADQA